MIRTQFAGLTQLEEGESLASDDFSFQERNPAVTDVFLALACRFHRHDAHDPLEGADIEAVAEVDDTGGTIPAELSIIVGYTLVDLHGGETVLAGDAVSVTTQEELAEPDDAPTLVLDHDAGNLLAGNYSYGITVTDGLGGETAIGPMQTVTIDPGEELSEITISGLAAIVTASEGTGWRLWRSVDGGPFSLLDDGVDDSVLDDGSFCLAPNLEPPTGSGTTNNTSRLRVTVPSAGQPADAVTFRIYATAGDEFGSPSLLGEYPVADFDDEKVYTTLATLLAGAPPHQPTAVAGADKIDALTDILHLYWKAPVLDEAALPATDNTEGDVRLTLDTGGLWRWDGDSWEAISGGGGGADLDHIPLYDKVAWVNGDDDEVSFVTTTGGGTEPNIILNDVFPDAGAVSGDYTILAGDFLVASNRLEAQNAGENGLYFNTTLNGDLTLSVKCDMEAGWLDTGQSTALMWLRDDSLAAVYVNVSETLVALAGTAATDSEALPGHITNGACVFWLQLQRTGDDWEARVYDSDPLVVSPDPPTVTLNITPTDPAEAAAIGKYTTGRWTIDTIDGASQTHRFSSAYAAEAPLPTAIEFAVEGDGHLLLDAEGASDVLLSPRLGVTAEGFFDAAWTDYPELGRAVSVFLRGGEVYLEGVTTKDAVPAAGDPILTLPPGYRPTEVVTQPVATGNEPTARELGMIDIGTDGIVSWQAGADGATEPWVSFDGVSFRL